MRRGRPSDRRPAARRCRCLGRPSPRAPISPRARAGCARAPARTPATRDTNDTFASTAGSRRCGVTSSPSTIDRRRLDQLAPSPRRTSMRRRSASAPTSGPSCDIDAALQRDPRDGAIHRAGIEEAIAKARGDERPDGALAGRRRSVDGDGRSADLRVLPPIGVLPWLRDDTRRCAMRAPEPFSSARPPADDAAQRRGLALRQRARLAPRQPPEHDAIDARPHAACGRDARSPRTCGAPVACALRG